MEIDRHTSTLRYAVVDICNSHLIHLNYTPQLHKTVYHFYTSVYHSLQTSVDTGVSFASLKDNVTQVSTDLVILFYTEKPTVASL